MKLNRELGISLVYITHDLTTAYQVCDNVVVMYGGSIVEAGHVESVIHTPQHPYTQLLVSSIPLMDRSQRWAEDEIEEPASGAGRVVTGCKFAPRCRFVMQGCWEAQPPLYRVGTESAAACILHRDGGALNAEELVEVLG
jgi:oligopeptide/dipeptide ABC transporter ATP-binding protein